jgi:OmpA-OmpF porin, OOP family
MVRFAVFVAFLVAFMATAASAQAQKPAPKQPDAKGSTDHPLVPRYKDSEIRNYNVEKFTEYTLVAGPTKRGPGSGRASAIPEKPIALEGKVTTLIYRAPPDRSSLEVFRNYQEALKTAGFETLFTCARSDCGYLFNAKMNPDIHNGLLYDKQQQYLAARLARPAGDVYVALYVTTDEPSGRAYVKLEVIELKAMEQQMVVVKADEMEDALTRNGKVAIYGILFDFDKADIKPESKLQIDQLGELLKKNPKLEVLIVGHTDGQGAFDYNLSLSQRRAQSIVNALATSGIAANRLTPAGAGMVAPVATNRTEEGRATNRRVEIVERVVAAR